MTPTVKQLRQAGYKVRVQRYRYLPDEEYPISTFDIKQESEYNDLRDVMPHGGITVVTISLPGDNFYNVQFTGESICRRDEQFVSKLGLDIAIGRAVHCIERLGHILPT